MRWRSVPVRRRPPRPTRPTQGIGQRDGPSLRPALRFAPLLLEPALVVLGRVELVADVRVRAGLDRRRRRVGRPHVHVEVRHRARVDLLRNELDRREPEVRVELRIVAVDLQVGHVRVVERDFRVGRHRDSDRPATGHLGFFIAAMAPVLHRVGRRQTDWLIALLPVSFVLYFATLVQYNNQINNVNVNARFQWRFKPASDLFIVYTENYLPSAAIFTSMSGNCGGSSTASWKAGNLPGLLRKFIIRLATCWLTAKLRRLTANSSEFLFSGLIIEIRCKEV